MQDPSFYSQIKAQVQQQQQQQQSQFPEQEHLRCPRCDSTNTKFCYYNNYNLSQPRHFCKNCRRYWTKGGALRNIPVGGGSRKNSKRSSSASSTTSAAPKRPAPPPNIKSESQAEANETKGDNLAGQFGNLLEAGGSFSTLLGTNGGHFGNFLDGLRPNGSSLQMTDHFGDPGSGQNVDQHALQSDTNTNGNGDGFLNIHGGDGGAGGGDGGGCWSGGTNGWPDLAMYTPGSTFL